MRMEMVVCDLTHSFLSMHVLHPAVAQKLSGKVRVANVRYTESFRNASSQEYRDFVELFVGMVSWAIGSRGWRVGGILDASDEELDLWVPWAPGF
jgi:hypothetical protein